MAVKQTDGSAADSLRPQAAHPWGARPGLDPPDRIVDREVDGDDGEHAEAGRGATPPSRVGRALLQAGVGPLRRPPWDRRRAAAAHHGHRSHRRTPVEC